MRPPPPVGQTPALRYCGSCGTPLDGAALAACWCPACGMRITSSGDAVAEGPDEPTVPQQVGLVAGRLAPEGGPTIPIAKGAWSLTPEAMSAWLRRTAPSRWVIGALALAMVVALLSGLLVTLAAHGNLQMVIGPDGFSHSGASTGSPKASAPSSGAAGALATVATQQTPGTFATPSPVSGATPGTTPTSTEAAALSVTPTSFRLIACVAVPAQVQITVSDSGGTSLGWSARAPGYKVTPPDGTLAAGGSITVTVSNIQQSGVVTFIAPGVQDSPKQVSISCTV